MRSEIFVDILRKKLPQYHWAYYEPLSADSDSLIVVIRPASNLMVVSFNFDGSIISNMKSGNITFYELFDISDTIREILDYGVYN